jgi:outer membrane autotransporter protein
VQSIGTGVLDLQTQVESGGTLAILSGGAASSSTVAGGGTESISSGGTVVGTTLNSAAVLDVADGGSATGVVLNGGATLITTTSATLSGTYETASASGTFNIAGNSASGVMLENGGSLTVLSGGLASATILGSGGTETVLGTDTGAAIGAGGTQLVNSGGVSISATISGGGAQSVLSAGFASATTIGSGGVQTLLSGGSALGSLVQSGGEQMVSSGGVAISSTLLSGGLQDVRSGATVLDTVVHPGAVQNVDSGSIASGTIIVGGSQNATSSTVVNTVVSGGTLTMSAGSVASGTVVSSGGTEVVLSGAVASGTSVISGGSQSVLGGGAAYNTVVGSGALQYVDGVVEGYAYNTLVSSGGEQEVAFGGTGSGTLVQAGGLQTVESSGIAYSATIDGTQVVQSGGLASGTNVLSGGVEQVLAGGSATSTTVSGGTLLVDGTLTGLTDEGGSTVSGSGTIASDFSLARGSQLLANTPGATLRVSGNLGFTAGSTYGVTLSTGGQNGAVAVGGNVTIGTGTTLVLSAQSGQYSPGTVYKILSYGGSETGTFSAVSTPLAYMGPVVQYEPGVIEVELSPTSGFTSQGFTLSGSTVDETAVAGALTGIYAQGGNSITKSLIADTRAQATNVLSQVAGDEAANAREIAADRTEQGEDLVASHLAATTPTPAQGLWAAGSAEHDAVNSDATLGASGWQDNSMAATLGYDSEVSQTVRVGAALMLNNDSVDFSERDASSHVDGAQALLYGSYEPRTAAIYVRGVLGLGDWDNSQSRTVSADGSTGKAQGTFSTTAESFYVEAGLDPLAASTHTTVQPYVGLRAGHYRQAGYDEHTGMGSGVSGAFDLDVAGAASNSVASVVGARLVNLGGSLLGRALQVQTDVSWEHSLTGTNRSVSAAFASNPGEQWQVYGTSAERDMARISVGASWKATEHMTLTGTLAAETGSHSEDYGMQLGAQWKW